VLNARALIGQLDIDVRVTTVKWDDFLLFVLAVGREKKEKLVTQS